MKPWRQSMRDAAAPTALATVTTLLTVALRGRHDSGSALAPINATSHVLWGPRAAASGRVTVNHTLPGLLINAGATGFWALVMERLFGARLDARGKAAAPVAAAATAALAYLTDYHLVPRRLTPGWEHRISHRSLALAFGALALGLGAGAALARAQR
ncbi:hypothetical protein HUS23_08420 [Ectothiorhodospiraceae bacterium 2226]|nr:hypothetical protein HUS23_08420 [Ectothiorhodospiraceae bacterium 2226]